MVRIEYKRMLCCFLAVFLILSSICVKNVKAYSVFDGTPTAETSIYIDSLGAKICDSESCTAQMLGIRGASHIQGSMYYYGRYNDLKILADYIDTGLWGQGEIHFYEGKYILQFPSLYGKAVIIRFMHKQDGKKKKLS